MDESELVIIQVTPTAHQLLLDVPDVPVERSESVRDTEIIGYLR